MQHHRKIEEKINKVKGIRSNRSTIVRAIREYSTLVHDRNEFGGNMSTDVFAVDESIQPFVSDAVKAAFSLLWNPAGTPFKIVHNEKHLNDDEEVINYYNEMAWMLETECNNTVTDFKYALEQCLKLMFEYGSAFMFLTRHKKSFFCQALSLESVWVAYDTFRQIETVVITQSNGFDSLIEKDSKSEKWLMHTKQENRRYKTTEYNYLPVFALFSEPPDVGRLFPIGAGLSSLPEIRKLNRIIIDLTRGAAAVLKPTEYRDAGQNIDNRGDDHTSAGGRVVDVEMGGAPTHLPLGYIPAPSDPRPAWELWTQMITRIREKFGSINRLLTLKDNVQITATEANIRSQTDIDQLKNLLDNIFSRFLNPIHNAQLKLLKLNSKNLPPLPEVLKGKQYDVSFFHNSIFQRAEENQRAQEIQSAVAEFNNLIQVSANAQQSGLSTVSFEKLAAEIARLHGLPTQSLPSGGVPTDLLRNLIIPPADVEDGANSEMQSMMGGML